LTPIGLAILKNTTLLLGIFILIELTNLTIRFLIPRYFSPEIIVLKGESQTIPSK
jgi:hypothetical protein